MLAQPRDVKSNCLTRDEIIKNVGEEGFVLNSDGTVSVFYLNPKLGLYPVQLTLECCKVLDPNYYFDINTQTCRWAQPHDTCGFSEPINLIVNPKGDDGTLFFVDDFEKETCDLKISFDYLLKIKCEDLLNISNPTVATNIQSQEIIDQIINTEMDISEVNVQIETLTNQILVLNEQYTNTPYSIFCDHFPVTATTNIPCVRPTNLPVTFYESNHVIVNKTTPTEACALWTLLQIPNNIYASDTGSPYQTTSFTIGGRVYQGYNVAGCGYISDGYHVIIGRGVIHITNSVIDGIYTNCPITASTTKLNNFDNSGFSPKSLDTTLIDTTVYQKDSTTTYITVNYCLTDLGLQTWQTILGPTRYQQFILGDPASYTCTDVITLTNQTNTAQLFTSCNTSFGTKSQIWVQITQHMDELTNLNNLLTEYQNTLITLQNSFETIISDGKGCQTPIEALESLDIEMHLDVVNSDNSLTSVFTYPIFPAINATSNLYNYLINNGPSGFYICGDPSKDNVGLSACTTLSLDENLGPNVDSCNSIVDDLINALIGESGNASTTIPYDAFASPWKTYTHVISNVSDSNIIAAITNKKIKISFRVKFSCVDFCLLLDNIVLDKTCKSVDRHDITISQNPGFDLKRVIDNKKSWIDTTVPTNRDFLIAKNNGNNPIRQTDYNVNDERLVINSKEIDLDISVASAIETDVWCYLNDNPCLLTGYTSTSCTSCQSYNVDFHSLVTQPISAVTTIEQFENLMTSELIDAKNRQTISAYPTLRAVYDRYLHSSDYCDTVSSGFDYQSMDKFAGLIGSYWVDLIEQVVPSTTIWGSVKIYTNTIFDEQKFKYKSYSSLLCKNPFQGQQVLSPINGVSGVCQNVNVKYTDLSPLKTGTTNTYTIKPIINVCDNLCIAQMNSGSEFISYIETPKIGCNTNTININECDLGGKLDMTNEYVGFSETYGGTLPFTYLWSTGETTETINMLPNIAYSLTITDAKCCQFTMRISRL